ncbi:MAG: response regulator [Candidatus Omnitrophica bacterium]|nr:response regulator [Candidatus Omnitrophota bacterium]
MAKRILIIDDEIDVMKMLVYRIEAKGYEVLTATNGKEAIEITKTNIPNLIFLDYRLPDMKASDISKIIRENDLLKNIPIILITASIEEIMNKAQECGANDYIGKPIEPDILYAKIAKYIKLEAL